jgi:hypothetical protein
MLEQARVCCRLHWSHTYGQHGQFDSVGDRYRTFTRMDSTDSLTQLATATGLSLVWTARTVRLSWRPLQDFHSYGQHGQFDSVGDRYRTFTRMDRADSSTQLATATGLSLVWTARTVRLSWRPLQDSHSYGPHGQFDSVGDRYRTFTRKDSTDSSTQLATATGLSLVWTARIVRLSWRPLQDFHSYGQHGQFDSVGDRYRTFTLVRGASVAQLPSSFQTLVTLFKIYVRY